MKVTTEFLIILSLIFLLIQKTDAFEEKLGSKTSSLPSPSSTQKNKTEIPKVKVTNFGKYRLEVKIPTNYYSCDPLGGRIYESDKEIALLNSLCHYAPVEIHDKKVFWSVRTANANTNKNWEDQLWMMQLGDKKKEKLFSSRGLDFRVSPNGKKVIIENYSNLYLITVENKKQETIANTGEGGRDDGFTLIAWSSDSEKFWFGSGVVESWTKLGLFEKGHVKWFDYKGGSNDEAFEPDRGWLVTSDTPSYAVYEEVIEFKKTRRITHLTLFDVFTGKKVELASAQTNQFEPKWISNDILSYLINDREYKISAAEIKKKLR